MSRRVGWARPSALSELEAAVLDALLAGDLPALACLRAQRARMRVAERELTGVGLFTELVHPRDVVRLASPSRVRFGHVMADVPGLAHGAGFVIYVDHGLITMLEGYTVANEPWPEEWTSFRLRYRARTRDLGALALDA